MDNTLRSPISNGQVIDRSIFLELINAALSQREFRFGRELTLAWLASFPGDLEARLALAKFFVYDHRTLQALPILEGLCAVDPESLPAQELYHLARKNADLPDQRDSVANLLALGSISLTEQTSASWGRLLWMARQSLFDNDLDNAELLIRQVLASDPFSPLVGVTHLRILAALNPPLPARKNLAEYYYHRWADCIPCVLYLADWRMEGGDVESAVHLLHKAASHDVSGQVATRIWGESFPYQTLWPNQLELRLDLQIPASIGSFFGWNQLNPGVTELAALDNTGPQPTQSATISASKGVTLNRQPPIHPTIKEELIPIRKELELVASRLQQPEAIQSEGRFPVYVIFSSRKKLFDVYGETGAEEILTAMSRIKANISLRKGWDALVFLPDDPQCSEPLGISLAESEDPWQLKLALADLDVALAKRGEMIGALLIVGGPEIIPFHRLPNPVDDDDADVPSDNPYGTRDENYFIPEWPVGRLPGGAGNDPQLLLSSLQRIQKTYASKTKKNLWVKWFFENLPDLLRSDLMFRQTNLGFTAEIWRQASYAVFRPIGNPQKMLISPPISLNGAKPSQQNPNTQRLSQAQLSYFNLHGIPDAPEWFGHRDPLVTLDGPDYPVALRPEDLEKNLSQLNSRVPEIVFSEACYGVYIQDKQVDEALALKFLAGGSQAIVGSTVVSYGSISPPLIGADLLGYSFWEHLRNGQCTGEALRLAKVKLASEMHDRQGYLDGEDQKTLISFLLYGDPLAQPRRNRRLPKHIQRPIEAKDLNTICDRAARANVAQSAPPEMLEYVKRIVSQYLPEMQGASFLYSTERQDCNGTEHTCPTGQSHHKHAPHASPNRTLFTLSKQVKANERTHTHYARLKLDQQGKLVKLVVSR
jgi:hypothetical protein